MTSISNGESGSSVRTKLNVALDQLDELPFDTGSGVMSLKAAGGVSVMPAPTRASIITNTADFTSGTVVQTPDGLAWIKDGGTSISDMSGWSPFGLKKAGHYGAVGDGSTSNDSVVWPTGVDLDFNGGVYKFTSTPTFYCNAFNGATLVGTSYKPLPRKVLSHPLDGQITASLSRAPGALHTGPIWYEPTENRIWRAFAETGQHAPDQGMRVEVQFSDDNGNKWSTPVTVFSDKDLSISAMTGGIMGSSRFGLLICASTSGGTRTMYWVKSDDLGVTWSAPAAVSGLSVNHFLYGPLYSRPTVAGGDDDDGFICYTYVSNKCYALTTSDNGDTWADQEVYDGTGAGYTVNEMVIARVNNETKWVGYIRGEDNYLAFVTTDMINLTVVDSGIDNTGSQGQPPFLICEGGKMYLYRAIRENWSGTADELRAGQFVYTMEDALTLYAAGGVFTDKTNYIGGYLPARAIGMMFSCTTPYGRIAVVRVGETVYTGAGTDAVENYLVQISTLPMVLASPAFIETLRPRPNLLHNGSMTLWRPQFTDDVEVTGLAGTSNPTAERWATYNSGATFDVTKESVASNVSRNLSFRPAYGMRLVSTGGDFSGIRQVHYGPIVLRSWADRIITVQVWGLGSLPAEDTPRIKFVFNYGTGGTPSSEEEVISDLTYFGQADGVWSGFATIRTPTMDSKTFGTAGNAKVSFYLDCGSATDAWNTLILGVKAECGDCGTPLEQLDISEEKQIAAQYFQVLGEGGSYVGHGVRTSTTNTRLGINYSPKLIVPTVAMNDGGTASHFTVENVSSAPTVSVVGMVESSAGKSGAMLDLTHGVTTDYEAAIVHTSNSSTWIEIDCEPAVA